MNQDPDSFTIEASNLSDESVTKIAWGCTAAIVALAGLLAGITFATVALRLIGVWP